MLKHGRPTFVNDAITRAQNDIQIGQYKGYTLYSAYQPIWHYNTERGFSPYGYEGLIRPFCDGEAKTPKTLFDDVERDDRLFVECLCHALHLRNYHHCQPIDGKLFFNINPQNYPSLEEFNYNFKFLLNKLSHVGIERENIVLEVVETDQSADGILEQIHLFSRDEGIKLAIDDFGQECSTLERYLAFKPEIVKVDRDVFHTACESFIACRMLHKLISQFHAHGTTVLIEGIETHKQFDVAVTLGAELFQGFLLGRPTILPNKFSAPQYIGTKEALYA